MTICIGVDFAKAYPVRLLTWYQLPRIDGVKPVVTDDIDLDEKGYLIEHITEKTPNIIGYDHRVSWLNCERFSKLYYPSGECSSAMAFDALDLGLMITNAIFREDGYIGVVKDKMNNAFIVSDEGQWQRWVPDIPLILYQHWEVVEHTLVKPKHL